MAVVVDSGVPTLTAFRIDDADTNLISYSQSWRTSNGYPNSYNLSVHITGAVGDTATFSFQGTRCIVVGLILANEPASSNYVLDDGLATAVSVKATSSIQYNQQFYDSGTLTNGKHTLTIEYTGQNEYALDYVQYYVPIAQSSATSATTPAQTSSSSKTASSSSSSSSSSTSTSASTGAASISQPSQSTASAISSTGSSTGTTSGISTGGATASPDSTNSSQSSSPTGAVASTSHSNVGGIAGGAIGAIIVIIALAVLLFLCYRRRLKAQYKEKYTGQSGQEALASQGAITPFAPYTPSFYAGGSDYAEGASSGTDTSTRFGSPPPGTYPPIPSGKGYLAIPYTPPAIQTARSERTMSTGGLPYEHSRSGSTTLSYQDFDNSPPPAY